ncbi:MAG: hypothetical protein CVU40_00710 [Chloroflexi bacterium HGW-Chloroflexi-2]|nr:MAG: hypothetical protein CVU40_00710 [Chloroflexi bacterium HGW-Chloroflexi-2]
MFDLFIYPFGFKNNEEYSNLIGYFAGNVHRKATRTRVEDIIVIRFTPFRKLNVEDEKQINQIVAKTGDQFYKTKGPITTAAKLAGEFFNNLLNQINIINNSQSPILGSFHLLVLNKDDLYLVLAGGSTSYHLSRTKIEKFEDRTYGIEGVGVGKTIKLRFFHTKINESDRIILTTKSPKTWTKESLFDYQGLSISHLRRSLRQLSQDDFEAVIIQFRSGNGSVHQLKLDSAEFSFSDIEDMNSTFQDNQPVDGATISISEDYEDPQEKSILLNEISEEKMDGNPQDVTTVELPDFMTGEVSDKSESNQISDQIQLDIFHNEEANPPQKAEEIPHTQSKDGIYLSGDTWDSAINIQEKAQKKKTNKNESKAFAIFLLSIRKYFHNLDEKYKKITNYLKKGLHNVVKSSSRSNLEKDSNSLSSSSMLMIAILVAVFVSALGITVYFQSGIGSQQTELIANANLLISDALDEPDVNNQILMYQEALRLVTESESYGKSESTNEIKRFIQIQLDELQGVTRIDIQPTIFGGLDKRIQISRMGINANGDVYALDSGTGRVIRMIATRPDYMIDNSFLCGPGKYGDVIVDPLIDIEPVNYANKINTSLMGIDGRGNLLMCIPGSNPIAIELKRSDLNWGEIKALAFNGYSLYVLDSGSKNRDIYRYPSNDFAFDQVPESIFSSNIPENLAGSLDISVNQEELFLVHSNGQLTRCNLNQLTCENDTGYGLILGGKTRESYSVLPGTEISQVYVTLPPDPSIYFMDEKNQAIYHFSMALNLQQQISPNLSSQANNLDESSKLTAFTVNPNGIIHFAYGNLIYFGYLP